MKKREIERLRRAVEEVSDLAIEAIDNLAATAQGMEHLGAALQRATEELRAAREAFDAAEAEAERASV